MNLIKNVKDLYMRNHKTLLRGIQKRKWKAIPCSWMRGLKIVNMTALQNCSDFFPCSNVKLMLKSMWNLSTRAKIMKLYSNIF
jgi:hypothetical protein